MEEFLSQIISDWGTLMLVFFILGAGYIGLAILEALKKKQSIYDMKLYDKIIRSSILGFFSMGLVSIMAGKDLTNKEEIIEESKWDNNRIRNAVNYLKDREFVKVIFFLGGTFLIEKIFPEAIDLIENNGEFLELFGFKKNLESFSFDEPT